ncbi:MAG: tetratricopeptide repeat protein [Deltaproteobacteria bacterium]|nr:tetratricopeptide repeat protein [Deltaproteobacteria bacterium]
MSLINDMLRDLETRSKQDKKNCPDVEAEAVVGCQSPEKSQLWLYAIGFLLLGGIVWSGLKFVPGTLPNDASLSVKAIVQPVPSAADSTLNDLSPSGSQPEVGTPVKLDAVSLATAFPLVQDSTAKLLGLGISESATAVQLRLTFAQLPEYRLLQNGVGAAQLVVSFSRTQLGGDFDVPELTGELLQRISLLPRQETLQLLVDLDDRAQVQSFQLVESNDREYQLIIDIAAVTPLTKTQEEPTPQPAAKVEVAPVIPALPSGQPVVVSETAKVSKSNNPLSRDQQAYQSGLEQLDQGNATAAEASFLQALSINPQLLEARLQLVSIFLGQQKLSKAETQLRQGLVVAPGNAQLRKQYARFLLNEERHAEAIASLRANPAPAIGQDLEYHALLAALLQETKQFTAAADLYARLLQLRPEQAVWWLGLAISMDQSGRFDQARNAYERASALPGLRPDLQNYIRSRLQVL